VDVLQPNIIVKTKLIHTKSVNV